MWSEPDRIVDAIPLLTREKERLQQLEGVIETHIEGFLLVGRALGEIRVARLYRETYPTFEAYVRERWGMHRARADDLIRSATCADMLLESTGSPNGKTPLPADVPEAVLRSLSTVPSPELQQATWRLLAKASPNGKPTRVVARSICKLIRQAVDPEKNTPQQVPFQPLFVRPIHRLARMDFDAGVACLHVGSSEQATQIISACEVVIDRCRAIQAQLSGKFADREAGNCAC